MTNRPEVLEGVNLRLAPKNELGVVLLFAELARRWRIRVEEIRPGFPDCIAYQRMRRGDRRIRIEFELRSRNFKDHGHNSKKCDWIVCWEHNWPGYPRRLTIVELRREFGLGRNVWILPLKPKWKPNMDKMVSAEWSVPSQAHAGDLVLVYLTSPESCIRYVYCVSSDARLKRAGWKPGKDYRAVLAPVAALKGPVFLQDLKHDRVLRTAHFVRGNLRGKANAMDYWPYLHRLLVRRNPQLKKKLRSYEPGTFL